MIDGLGGYSSRKDGSGRVVDEGYPSVARKQWQSGRKDRMPSELEMQYSLTFWVMVLK